MTEDRRQRYERVEASKEASELFEKAASLPGVAELMRLYNTHAALLAKANNYSVQRSKVTVFTSSDATG